MKFFHNAGVARFLAVTVEILIHGSFAAGAFLLGGFLGSLILHDVAGVGLSTTIGAWGLAAIVFFGAMQAFVYGEYHREDVDAYEEDKGDGSYRKAWRELKYIISGIEICSLLYRVWQVGNLFAGLVTFLLGILALRYAYALAKVIHATANRPVDVAIGHARERAGTGFVGDALKLIDKMSARQKARFHEGDVDVLDEVQDASFREQRDENERQERRRRDRETNKGMASEMFGKFRKKPDVPFTDAQTSSQDDRLSRNGVSPLR